MAWDEGGAENCDTNVGGIYEIKGITSAGISVTLTVKVEAFNYVSNYSFEDEDTSMWTITAEGADPTDYQRNSQDAHTGDMSLHYWSESDMDFTVSQNVTGLASGKYRVEVFSQGGDFNADSMLLLFAEVNGEETTAAIVNNGWVNWQNPQVEVDISEGEDLCIGVRVKANAKAWGTFDDFMITKIG